MNIKSYNMPESVNKLGKNLPQNGSVGSPLWIKTNYPEQLHQQVKSYMQQKLHGIANPTIEFNGDLEYDIDFVRAVKLYVEYPEWL